MTTHFTFNERAHFTWCCWRERKSLDDGDTVVHDEQLTDCEGMAERRETERQEYERARDSGDWEGRQTEAQWLMRQRYVRATVAEAPPFTPERREKLAQLLQGARGHRT